MVSKVSNGSKQIAINAHLISGQDNYRRAGIHQYIYQLLAHLPQFSRDFDYTVYANHTADLNQNSSMHFVGTRMPTERPLARILWEQLLWPPALLQAKADLLHSMAFVTPFWRPCSAIVTVYDLSFIYYPERYPAFRRFYLTSQTRRSCRSARRVVAISESGRQDIHRLFEVPMDRIDVVPPGVTADYCQRPKAEVEAFRQREALPEQFLLHVGTLQPRKNLLVLLEALAQIKRPELLLVFIGGKGWYYEEIFARVKALNLTDQVRFTGYVPDEDLPLWYNAATIFVFPSIYEGFGMPVLEAIACGTAVIAADTSSIPEVVGEAARLFAPHDVDTLAEHIQTMLDNPDLLASMQAQGLERARLFSWEKSAEQMITVYEEALA
ncbi:MAG: glycosyltransferase family 1 protein [Candidatus Promineifilaceae bacterium]